MEATESENPRRHSGDRDYNSLSRPVPPRSEGESSMPKASKSSSYNSDLARSAGFNNETEHAYQLPEAQDFVEPVYMPHSPSDSADTSASGRGVPGSARWLRERTEALEAERLALVKQTLEVQGLLDSVKIKVRTARDITAGLEMTNGPEVSSLCLNSLLYNDDH